MSDLLLAYLHHLRLLPHCSAASLSLIVHENAYGEGGLVAGLAAYNRRLAAL